MPRIEEIKESGAGGLAYSHYRSEHRPGNQNTVCGIIINPKLHPNFEATDFKSKDAEEVREWWLRPYIVTTGWLEIKSRILKDLEFLRDACPREYALREKELDLQLQEARADWFSAYPTGTRYEIRCLDGRVQGRATIWGTEGTLEAAIRVAQRGPSWTQAIC